MQIRYADSKDKNQIIDIWNYCFGDSEGFVKYYFSKKYDEKNTVVLQENEKITSALQLNQYKLKLNDNVYNTSYVVGVSTLPEARGRGYMKDIMEFSLKSLYEKGQLVSLLMPIDYRLYRKYGYENCYDILEYKINIDELSRYKLNGSLEELKYDKIETLVEIYKNSMKKLNATIIRDKNYYDTLFEEVKSEGGHIYLYKEEDYKGYIIYFVNGENLFVRDMLYDSKNALESMLKFIYNHNTQCKETTIMTPINDNLKHILHNPKTCSISIKPFMMGRIINVVEFLKSIKIETDIEISSKINIIDNQISQNNGVFKISIKDSKINVEKILGEYDYSIDINKLSQLGFSYLSFEEILELQENYISKIDKSVVDLFEVIFNVKNNYIQEYV